MQLRDQGFWVGMAEGFIRTGKGFELKWERDGKLAKQSLHQNYWRRKRILCLDFCMCCWSFADECRDLGSSAHVVNHDIIQRKKTLGSGEKSIGNGRLKTLPVAIFS
jgi:hypothetical protein